MSLFATAARRGIALAGGLRDGLPWLEAAIRLASMNRTTRAGGISLRAIRRLLGLLLLGLAATGCSTFNRGWKAAASAAAPPNDITGRWEGTWRSDVTGHHGKLRCLVAHLEGGDYQARYRAKYLRIMSFSYPVRLKVAAAEHGFRFNGEADLGWYAGGLYQYEGRASATNFVSTYKSKEDHGSFQMTRPASKKN